MNVNSIVVIISRIMLLYFSLLFATFIIYFLPVDAISHLLLFFSQHHNYVVNIYKLTFNILYMMMCLDNHKLYDA